MPATIQKKEAITPQEVRQILGIDNREIVNLCRSANITPKKNINGQIYFSKKEFEVLKKINNEKKSTSLAVTEQRTVITNLMTKLENIEQNITKNITDSVAKTIDEKLDGMDEVVVELIRCKTENENLRQKINELNKENYYLKNTLNSYKPLALGLYVKREDDFLM
ncbi:helix-turn-helix domain-containing protein [bacterium]|nr:helix-turn-helix domain-containing protein [bacterium]